MNEDKYNRYINAGHNIDGLSSYVYKYEEPLLLKNYNLNNQAYRLKSRSSIKSMERAILRLNSDDDT